MTFFHCRYASLKEPNPCRCPVFESPDDVNEDGSEAITGDCDTCDHRAEWHLSPVESTPEKTVVFERCKASLIADQVCPCPLWVKPNENSQDRGGCELCGHKKGWHRAKVTAPQPVSQKSMPARSNEPLPISTPENTVGLQPSTSVISTPFHPPSRPNYPSSLSGSNHSRHGMSWQKSVSARSDDTHALSPPESSTGLHQASHTSTPLDHPSRAHHPSSLHGSTHSRPALGTMISSARSASNLSIRDPIGMTSQASQNTTGTGSASRYQLKTIQDSPILIAAEHMQFIMGDVPEERPLATPSDQRSLAGQSDPTSSTSAADAIRTAYLSHPSPPLTFSSGGATEPPTAASAAVGPSFGPLQEGWLAMRGSPKTMADGVRERLRSESSRWSSTSSERMTAAVERMREWDLSSPEDEFDQLCLRSLPEAEESVEDQAFEPIAFPSSSVAPSWSIRRTPTTGSLGRETKNLPANSPSLSLRADVTTETHVEELPKDDGTPRHPSELGIGKFAIDPHSLSRRRRANSVDSAFEAKPFQSGFRIGPPVPSRLVLKPVAHQRFDTYRTKGNHLTFSVSPPPSTHIFTPGEAITIKVQLKAPQIDSTMESVLSRWANITLRLIGSVARTGQRDDSTMHQILNIEQTFHPISSDGQQPKQIEWRKVLSIPTHAMCSCGPGALPLPGSSSSSIGIVSYSITLKAKRRQSIIGTSTELLGADLKLRDPISSSVSSMLTTTSTKTSSIAMWNPFTGSHRASVIGYQMIHHVIFLTSQNLRIIYKLEIDLSPDSEVSRSLIEKISSQAHFYLTLNGRTPLKAKVERGEVILRPRWCLTGHVDIEARQLLPGVHYSFHASIKTVEITNPITLSATVRELQSKCSLRRLGLGLSLLDR